MAVVTVAFEDLDSWLQNQPSNTKDTPYELNITGLTVDDIASSGVVGTLGNVIQSNGLKYVDLRYTVIPSSVIDMHECFSGCTSLTTAPNIPARVTIMQSCFSGCTSLTTAPDIPARVTSLAACFDNCRSLITAPDIPSGVTNMGYCFSYCTSLTTAPKIPDSVTDLTFCFNQCRSLITAPNIPSGVTMLRNCFSGCRSLTTAPKIPDSVTNMYDCFGSCTSLTTVPNIPDSVQNLNDCFSGCTSLEEITLFEADLATLVTNNKAQNCFYNCPNLTKIGTVEDPTPHEFSDWNIYRLKFDSNSVQGKVFHRDGTSHSITQTSITKSSLQLPILTDELWFPTESDSDIDAIIAKMIQYKYGVFKKEVIPPDEKSFVLMADDPDKVISNILGGGGSGGAVCDTESTNPAKVAKMKGYVLQNGNTFQITFENANTSASALTLNVNGTGAKPIYFNNSATSSTNYGIPAGTFMCKYNGTNYYIDTTYAVINARSAGSSTSSTYSDYSRQGAYCATASGTQAKVASMRNYVLQSGATFPITFTNANSYNGKITLNVNGTGAKDLYINNAVSSSSNKTLPAGTYICWYNGTVYYIDTGYVVLNARNANYATSAGSCSGNSASASRTLSRGNVTCETGTTVPAVSGVSMSQVYNNGYPTTYGNVMTLAGAGHGQLLLGWSGTSGARADAYIRSKRDVSSANWSDWYKLIDSGNIGSQTVDKANHIPTSKPDNTNGAIWVS